MCIFGHGTARARTRTRIDTKTWTAKLTRTWTQTRNTDTDTDTDTETDIDTHTHTHTHTHTDTDMGNCKLRYMLGWQCKLQLYIFTFPLLCSRKVGKMGQSIVYVATNVRFLISDLFRWQPW